MPPGLRYNVGRVVVHERPHSLSIEVSKEEEARAAVLCVAEVEALVTNLQNSLRRLKGGPDAHRVVARDDPAREVAPPPEDRVEEVKTRGRVRLVRRVR